MFFNSQVIQKSLGMVFIVMELGVIATIIFRTFQDNNIFGGVIALITKIPLSLLFVINALSFINPSGETPSAERKARRGAFTWLLFLTPITVALVRDKKGLFNPERIVATRRIY